MNARRLANGNLLIRARAEGPNGEVGDGVVEIGPDDPRYAVYLPRSVTAEEAEAQSPAMLFRRPAPAGERTVIVRDDDEGDAPGRD